MQSQALPALVTCLALAMYLWVSVNVAFARARYKVAPPATTGNADFERVFRTQQNTLEHLVLFLPCLWMFCSYVSPLWGAGLGLVWVLARVAYAVGYYAPTGARREPGFVIAIVANCVLLLGAVFGILRLLFAL
jgi:uncharacterized membrane protein YecN with MAPEG domain